ncbi:MAG: TRAP transporter small permease [Pseudomonadota bacterium]
MGAALTRAGQWLARICLILSALCLTALMGLTVVEVIGRYLLNAPIFGRQDIAQILLACSIFLAFPVVTLRGEQIDVDLLDGFISGRAGFWRDRIVELVSSIALLVMGYWLLERAEKALSRGSASEMLFLPKYPLLYLIAFIVLASGVLLLLAMLAKIVKGRGET